MKICWLSENFSKRSKEEIERFIIDCKSNIEHVKEIMPFFISHGYEYLEHFIEYFNLELDKDGTTSIFCVDDAKTLEYIILNGGNVRHYLKDGNNVLFHHVCEYGDMKLIETLTKYGVDINDRCNGDSLLTGFLRTHIDVDAEDFCLLIRSGYDLHTDYSSVDYCLKECRDSVLVMLITAGADWRRLRISYRKFNKIFKKIIRQIDEDMDNMVNNTVNDVLKTKLRLQDNNVKPFKSSGTNFYDLPHVQLLDAFHVFMYGSYAETHPLYNTTEKDLGMLEKLDLDQVDYGYYEKKLQTKLKQASIIFQCSAIGRELAQESYEACESSSKRLKI